ncbi:MAG: hypothetical protein KJ000_16195 [Pirellulaceae bacterium]|nr:hypothetical protein [Pirellulaceae bacterium]
MFKLILDWLADVADTLGEFFENLSKYPGLGFLGPLGDWVGSWADAYSLYQQKIEWKKQGLTTSKDKAAELFGMVKPDGSDSDEASPEPDAADQLPASDDSPQTDRDGTAASSEAGPGGSRPAGPRQAAPQRANLSGTIVFDSTTVVDQKPPDEAMIGRAAGGPPRPATDKPAYYGTLDGPGQSISGTVNLAPNLAPPDYSTSASRGTSPVRPQPPMRSVPAAVEPPSYDEPSGYAPPTDFREPRGQEAPYEPRGGDSMRPSVAPSAAPVARWEAAAPAPMTEEEAAVAWSIRQASSSLVEEDQPPLLPVAEREEQLARLDYFSYRLREAREPLCGLNGVLILIPLAMLREGTREHFELPRAIQGDLLTLQDSLGLRFPVCTMLVGLEEHRGFEELVRRIGPQRARTQRLGHRFDVRLNAIPTQLAALCVRLTGVFEDWVYAIFREHGSIARPGNSHLFGLLCQVRTDLQSRLLRILSGGFGRDRQEVPGELPLGFSGCYFAATGRSEDRRAFVRGVFDKLTEEQSQVEWLPESRAAARRYRRLGWAGLCVAAGFLGWLAFAVATGT